ncbi:MAG: transporter substrate-binding domain-containing protein [Defluviitaleaceae bacterium]|nr:transporter substrate-binding domain-containing protein [Defluviitaleaceae bacterium]
MKKIFITAICVLSFVLIFGACGGADTASNNDDAQLSVQERTEGEPDLIGEPQLEPEPDLIEYEEETPQVDDNISGEQAWTWNGHVYRIYAENFFPPFHMLNVETGEFYGFDIDILEAIATDQGFKVELHHVGFAAALGYLETGTADGMIAGMSITEERREWLDFSDGYFLTGQILVVPEGSPINEFANLTGETVAVKIGTIGASFGEQIAEQYGFDLVYYEDAPSLHAAVIMGDAAAAIDDRPVIEFAIHQGIPLETRGDTLNPRYYGFAVRLGEFPELIGMFNQGLANLRTSGYYYELLARYGLS